MGTPFLGPITKSRQLGADTGKRLLKCRKAGTRICKSHTKQLQALDCRVSLRLDQVLALQGAQHGARPPCEHTLAAPQARLLLTRCQ